MDLPLLLSRPEGKTLEFKRDLSSPDGFLKTIVAFANTAGGTILIGISDRTHEINGIPDPLDLELRIASLVSDSIRPQLMPSVEILPFRQTHVVAVQVHLSYSRPHFLARLGVERGTFVRVGSTNRMADADSLAEMERSKRSESYDETPMVELDATALDLASAQRAFEPFREFRRVDLRNLKLTTLHHGREVPTIGGFLLFGTDRHSFFPDAWIQLGRFQGLDRRHILDSQESRSSLLAGCDDALSFVRKHATCEYIIESTRRVERWSVPIPAIREAIINAVVHADYAQRGAPIRLAIFDNRIEFENPGLLYGDLTLEDIIRGVSRLRNRVLGRVFKELRLIEHWGTGIQRMLAICEEAGLDRPQFEEIGPHFRATIFLERHREPKLAPADQGVLELLKSREGLRTSEVAAALGVSVRTARLRLLSLVKRGLLVEVGSGLRDPQRRYHVREPLR